MKFYVPLDLKLNNNKEFLIKCIYCKDENMYCNMVLDIYIYLGQKADEQKTETYNGHTTYTHNNRIYLLRNNRNMGVSVFLAVGLTGSTIRIYCITIS